MSELADFDSKDKYETARESVDTHIDPEKYEPSDEQLLRMASLLDIIKSCETADIDTTVLGGYGLDGLNGKLTRNHDDIDMIIADEDLNKMDEIMISLGYRQDPNETDKAVFKNGLSDPHFKIEYAGSSALNQFSDKGVGYFVPTEPNAILNGQPFKAMTLKGQKEMIGIQNRRAEQNGWGEYSPAKRQNQSWLIDKLEKDGTV